MSPTHSTRGAFDGYTLLAAASSNTMNPLYTPASRAARKSPLCWMRCEMRDQQRRDLVRNLLGSKMPNASQDFELIWRSDKFCRALCCQAADRIVGITPNEQGGHLYDTERCADRATRTIPTERCLHCGHVAEHRNMQRNRCWWYVVRF